MLLRFKNNERLAFQSDVTWLGFIEILYESQRKKYTHIVMPEFQKIFQRRRETWENVIGILGETMAEGVSQVAVGKRVLDFGGLKLGLVGAMTTNTLRRRHDYFLEHGLLSRTLVLSFDPPVSYYKSVRRQMRSNSRRQTTQVKLLTPDKLVKIRISPILGEKIGTYVSQLKFDATDFRPEVTMRMLVCAAALLRVGPLVRSAQLQDLLYVKSFHSYFEEARISMLRAPQK